MIAAPSFRYDELDHAYYLNDQRIPSITQLIEMGGLVNGKDYFTEESRQRGTEVHALCADWDMRALDPLTVTSNRRPYLLAYIAACDALKPEWEAIEEADVHPDYKFAGRTDRVGRVLGLRSVVEIKSAAKARHHPVQTALQAILAAARWPLPHEHWQRVVFYVKHTGKFSVETHGDRRDFDTAFRLIKEFAS